MKYVGWPLTVALTVAAGIANAGNLCSVNPFTKEEAAQGKIAFDSHCAYCHQYNMTGRKPGNSKNESPDMRLLSESDLKFLDGNGGASPPLIGKRFIGKWGKETLTGFGSAVAGAAKSFPTKDFETPKSFFLITAYVLYTNCTK
jgi:hypothetical protein